METLLIFLAIIAIQIAAAYFKQKKKAAEKAKIPEYEPEYEEEYEDPVPDPFKEIREAMGLPPAPVSTPVPVPPPPKPPEPIRAPEPKPKPKLEPKIELEPIDAGYDFPLEFSQHTPERKVQINISKPAHGIIWAAILQQPRYRVKWKPPCYP